MRQGRSLGFLAAAVVVLTAATGSARAAQAVAPAPSEAAQPPPEPVPRLRDRVLEEVALTAADGRPYRIRVSTPKGPAPEGGFPVIYVLDGDAWFGTAVEMARVREWGRLSPTIVVAVGYPDTPFFNGDRRTRDFTPPGASDEGYAPEELGGADRFLDFLDGTLKPWVQAHRKVDEGREILFGHSFGGLFTLYALYTRPRSFDVYLSASPSLRFFDRVVFANEPRFLADPARKATRVLVTVGGRETGPPPAQVDDHRRYLTAHPEARGGLSVEEVLAEMFASPPDDYDKVGDTRAVAERMRAAGVEAAFVLFPGDEHSPAAVSALNRGMAFALRPPGTPVD